MHGLDANDFAPVLARDGEVLAANAVGGAVRTGSSEPVLAPLVAAAGEAGDAADLWVAVSSRFSTTALSGLLGELRRAGRRVQGFVDSAVLASAWLQPERVTVVLDMGATGAVLGVVAREGGDYRLRRSAAVPVGALDLREDWVRLLGASMVRQSRFDPLHDAVHERALRTALPELLEQAVTTGAAQFSLSVEDRQFPLTLSRDQFELAVRDRLRPLGDTLQALCAALGDCELVIPAAIARWPGVGEVLALAGSRPVAALAAGTVARAASLLRPAVARDGAVPYLTQLAPLAPAAPPHLLEPVITGVGVRRDPPTHLVYRGRALPISASGLVLGRDPGDGPDVLQLPEGIAGLSRRHCTLRRSGNDAVIVDHSRFGSFVDGVRVNGRTLLAAGSVLRLGTPGVELPLVAIATAGD